MELGKIFLSFADDLIQLVQVMFPNLPSIVTAGTVLVILLRMYRKYRRTMQHSVTLEEIAQNQKLIMKHMGVDTCANTLRAEDENSAKTSTSSRADGWLVRFVKFITVPMGIYQLRRMNMKEYLKKLGSRKFQAFLIVTITNVSMLVGYILNVEDVQGKVDAWLPAVNVVSQTIASAVYAWVEGGIDKSRGAGVVDYSQTDQTGE